MSDARRRVQGDDGAILAEFALALPLLALLAFGMIEYGAAWNEGNTLERVTSYAGRIAATQGKAPFTDYEVLQAVNTSFGESERVEIDRIIVYKVTGTDPAPPASCTAIEPSGLGTFGVAGLCNVYSKEQAAVTNPGVGFPRGSLSSPSCAGAWDSNWCPMTARDNDPPGIDKIGVEIRLEYEGFTKIAGTPTELVRRSIHEIEPSTSEDG